MKWFEKISLTILANSEFQSKRKHIKCTFTVFTLCLKKLGSVRMISSYMQKNFSSFRSSFWANDITWGWLLEMAEKNQLPLNRKLCAQGVLSRSVLLQHWRPQKRQSHSLIPLYNLSGFWTWQPSTNIQMSFCLLP